MKYNEVKKYLNKRILWDYNNSKLIDIGLPYSIEPKEGCITEISPSKNYIKINKKWYNIDDVEVVEKLGDSNNV